MGKRDSNASSRTVKCRVCGKPIAATEGALPNKGGGYKHAHHGAKQGGYSSIRAKLRRSSWNGTCGKCARPIPKGSVVIGHGGFWAHVDCMSKREVARLKRDRSTRSRERAAATEGEFARRAIPTAFETNRRKH